MSNVSKIAFVTPTFFPEINGVSVNIYDRVKTLKDKGYDCLIIAPKYDVDNNIPELNIVRYESIPMPVYPGSKSPKPFSSDILFLIKSFHPDIIHIDEPERIYLTQPRLLKKIKDNYPIVGFFHTDHLSFLNEYKINALRTCLKYLFYKSYSYCDSILASSYLAEERFEDNHLNLSIGDYLGVPLNLFQTTTTSKKYLTILGRLSVDRGVDKLLKILPECHLKSYFSKVLFIGDGPLKHQVLDMKLDIEHKVTGFIPRNEVANLLSETKVMLNSCQVEAFGLSFIEAFASNVPVVCLKSTAGIRFKTHGLPVYFYETESINSFNNAIHNSIISDLNINSNILSRWDIAQSVDNLIQKYQNVIYNKSHVT